MNLTETKKIVVTKKEEEKVVVKKNLNKTEKITNKFLVGILQNRLYSRLIF